MSQLLHFRVCVWSKWSQGLHFCVRCNIIHNSEDVKTAHMSICEWMERENVLSIQQNINQPWNRRKSCHLDGPRGHEVEWDKPVPVERVLHESIFKIALVWESQDREGNPGSRFPLSSHAVVGRSLVIQDITWLKKKRWLMTLSDRSFAPGPLRALW